MLIIIVNMSSIIFLSASKISTEVKGLLSLIWLIMQDNV